MSRTWREKKRLEPKPPKPKADQRFTKEEHDKLFQKAKAKSLHDQKVKNFEVEKRLREQTKKEKRVEKIRKRRKDVAIRKAVQAVKKMNLTDFKDGLRVAGARLQEFVRARFAASKQRKLRLSKERHES